MTGHPACSDPAIHLDPVVLIEHAHLRIALFERNGRPKVQLGLWIAPRGVPASTREYRLAESVTFTARKIPALIGRLMAAEARARDLGWLEGLGEHSRMRRREARRRS